MAKGADRLPWRRTDQSQLEELREELNELRAEAQALEAQPEPLDKHPTEQPAETESSRVVAVIEQEQCSGCGSCAEACPHGAIVVDDVAHVIADRCRGCGECLTVCPRGALTVGSVA